MPHDPLSEHAAVTFVTKDATVKALTVSLFEDAPVVRERLVILLADIDGVELIKQAVGAPEALIAIRQRYPDLVLLANYCRCCRLVQCATSQKCSLQKWPRQRTLRQRLEHLGMSLDSQR